MNVYIAGKFDARFRLRPYRKALQQMGYTCISTWLDQPADAKDDPETSKQEAIRDLAEIEASSIVIVDTIDESNTGGREVEVGWAMADGARIIIVGPCRNVFHHLIPDQFEDWEDALTQLEGESRQCQLFTSSDHLETPSSPKQDMSSES